MNIVYIWIEQYGCFTNNEFNFTNKYDFHYDNKGGKLEFNGHSKDYVENFFGNQIELTAIVGENGVGKTTLMEFIMTLSNGDLIPTNCIIVCEKINKGKRELTAYYTDNIICSLCDLCDYESLSITLKLINNHNGYSFPESNSLRIVYYTNCFNFSQYHETYGNSINLSTASCYWNEYANLSEIDKNIVIHHYHREIYNQVDFLTSKGEDVENFGIKYPEYIRVLFNYNDSYTFEKWYENYIKLNKNEVDKELGNKIFNKFLPKPKGNGLETFKYRMAVAMFSSIIHESNYIHPSLNSEQYKDLLIQLKRVYDSQNDNDLAAWNNLRKFFDGQIKSLKSFQNDKAFDMLDSIFVIFKAQEYIDFMDFIDNQLVFSESPFDYMNTLFDNNYFTIAFSANIKDNQADIKTEFSLFFEKYCQTTRILDYLSFEWNLSSGEIALLNVFARLFSVTIRRKNNRFLPEDSNSDVVAKNAIIMIDEADMMLHPSWQQQYIKSIIAFLSDVYKDTHLQLVIATHSPIILSDIPKQNVVYLRKNNNQIIVDKNFYHAETFGANIFRLFNDAFFLEEGAIGCFAEMKLAELLEIIDKEANQRKVEIKKRISLIGDGFLRKKIEQIFIDRLNVMSRIEELENQVKDIQKDISTLKSAYEEKKHD